MALHVKDLRLYFIASLRNVVSATIQEGDDKKLDVSYISVVCIKSLL
jgi:hypothetical protein